MLNSNVLDVFFFIDSHGCQYLSDTYTRTHTYTSEINQPEVLINTNLCVVTHTVNNVGMTCSDQFDYFLEIPEVEEV